jgi:L-2-hydroxyglutarate oxidase
MSPSSPASTRNPPTGPADFLIVGGGIIGLTTAYELMKRHPESTIWLCEKEERVAAHQTGRNSGVLHSGIYYKPGSLKAMLCREGKEIIQEFCAEHSIAYDVCGKVIVAVEEAEISRLQKIYERGQANQIQCEWIEGGRLRELEPHAAGQTAIHVPGAGIVDYPKVCEVLGKLIEANPENRVLLNTRVRSATRRQGVTYVTTSQGELAAHHIINCSGLYSDRVSRQIGLSSSAKIVPFRGEYFELKPQKRHLCRNLIYPVPDPAFPFLGVHFTRMIDGSVECGPNAVLALAREGYEKTSINPGDLLESLTFPGFLRLASRHWQKGLGELWRSFSKRAFVQALQRLMPDIRANDLEAAPSGVRAQALLPNGELVDDFLILQGDGVTSINNAPSPAATASFKIAQKIVDAVEANV